MKNSLKVGFVCHKYPLYKKGSHTQELINSLASISQEVVLIATPWPDKDFDKPENLVLKWVPKIQIPFLDIILFELFVFFRGLSKDFRSVDLINVNSAKGAFAAYFLGKLLKKPTVCTIEIINDSGGHLRDRFINYIQKWAYTLKYGRIICWSHYHAERYLIPWGVSEDTISVIPGGVDIEKYSPGIDGSEVRNKFPQNCTLIVFAKPMYEYNRKMAEFLIESVELARNKKDIRLLLGSGEQRYLLEEKISALKIGMWVTFMPLVPHTEVPRYIAASEIIVLPFTYQATTSWSLLESMAMGKPIVTTDVGEVKRVVTDNKNALIVKPEKEQVAKAILELIEDKELAQKLGKNAREMVLENYSIKKIAERTLNIYRELIG